jgi:hypothetical protein
MVRSLWTYPSHISGITKGYSVMNRFVSLCEGSFLKQNYTSKVLCNSEHQSTAPYRTSPSSDHTGTWMSAYMTWAWWMAAMKRDTPPAALENTARIYKWCQIPKPTFSECKWNSWDNYSDPQWGPVFNKACCFHFPHFYPIESMANALTTNNVRRKSWSAKQTIWTLRTFWAYTGYQLTVRPGERSCSHNYRHSRYPWRSHYHCLASSQWGRKGAHNGASTRVTVRSGKNQEVRNS